MKRTVLDAVISDLIRERSDWTCERCGKIYEEGRIKGKCRSLENSHWTGRGGKSTRWFPDNLNAFCTGCHFYMGGAGRLEYDTFKKKELGMTRFDDLVLRCNKPRKYTPADRKDMLIHYRAQWKWLRNRRKRGETGYIDFVSWD